MASASTTPVMEHSRDDGHVEEARVLRKVDLRLIPILFVTYMFNFMDKAILSSASVFGLIDDTHLVGQQYSWVSSIFYFGYFIWEYPTNYLIARLPVAKYLGVNTLFWGAVVALTASCVSVDGLMAVRFLLGVAEATITPAFMFITSTWYTRDEIPFRTGIWFSGNSAGGLIASLLAYGIGHIDPLHSWKWMFLILGIATFLWAFVLLFFLPDSISTANFLAPEEREFMTQRAVIAGTGRTEHTTWKWDQTIECLLDPKTWHLFGIALFTQIPNGGTQNFGNLVIKSFGFTSLQSTLINIPSSVISAATIAVTGWLASRSRRLTCILIVGIVAFSIAGSALIYARTHHVSRGVQLFGYFLLATGPGALPLAMSLVQANYKGVTKKMTMTALIFVAYCAGNIIGPHLFKTSEAPTYQTSFRAILACYIISAGLAISLRMYLQFVNAKRDSEEGVGNEDISDRQQQGKQTVLQTAQAAELQLVDSNDVTDWKTARFRYRL